MPSLKAAIIYFTLTNHTWEAACCLAEGLEEQGATVDMLPVERVYPAQCDPYHVIVLASPSHFCKPAQAMESFLDQLSDGAWQGKTSAVAAVNAAFGGKNVVSDLEKSLLRLGASVALPGIVVRAGVPLALRRGNPPSMADLQRCIAFGEQVAQAALNGASGAASQAA